MLLYTISVLPNLCAAAQKCAARAVEVCRGRMSKINNFNTKFQLRFQLSLKTFDFLNSATAHINCSIIISLHRCYVIIFYGLFRLALHGRSLRSLYRHDLLFPQSRTTIIAQHRAYASVKPRLLHDIVFEPLSILSDFKDKSQYYFPNSRSKTQVKTGSVSNFATNWISFTYRLRRSYSGLIVQPADCDLS